MGHAQLTTLNFLCSLYCVLSIVVHVYTPRYGSLWLWANPIYVYMLVPLLYIYIYIELDLEWLQVINAVRKTSESGGRLNIYRRIK